MTKDAKTLVFLITKYRRHLKWTHNDIVKLAHPKSTDPSINMILKYITKGFNKVKDYYTSLKQNTEETTTLDYVYEFLEAFTTIKKTTSEADAIKYIEKFHFHLEHIPTSYLKYESIWLALAEHSLPIDVILRNLNKLSSIPLFSKEDAKYVDLVCERLKNKQELNLTPFTLFNIWKAYEKGHSKYSKVKKWIVSPKLDLALQNTFHESLRTTGVSSMKKICVILNVWKYSRGSIYGNANINSLEAAVFMCLSHVFNEEECKIYCFSESTFKQIEMSRSEDNFKTAYDKIWNSNIIASTEYIKAIEMAANDGLEFDVFVIYTNLLLSRNLDVNAIITNYRKKLNKPKMKLIVVSLVASLEPVCSFNDSLALDLLGFRFETPNIIYNFISDKF